MVSVQSGGRGHRAPDVLVGLGVVIVMVGDDFRFGNGGAGDPDTLVRLGAEYCFQVDVVGDVQGGGRRVGQGQCRGASNPPRTSSRRRRRRRARVCMQTA